jgi:NAD(P)-dependent dehydrogenase (short-subunit alcohol dehydrogenase family)
MEGKICLVTGANAGIGKSTCLALASKGASVVMSARTKQQAEEVRMEIVASTGNPHIYLIAADLSSFKEVVKLTQEFSNLFERLDVLVNNAGIFLAKYQETINGYETQWQVNYLAHYLLTRRLIGLLKKSDDSRIINVSSNAHLQGTIDFQDLNGKHGYQGLKAYAQSKLANVLFTKELALRLKDQHISTYALHPGVVKTGIGNRNNQSWMSWAWSLGKPFMISPTKGAETIVYLAGTSLDAQLNGLYFVKKQPNPSSRLSNDPELAFRLWRISEEAVKDFL